MPFPNRFARGAILCVAFLSPAVCADEPKKDVAPQPESFRVPYQLTETKHVLVRVKINGKGPFNFIIDTGAPALFVGTETAKKVGVKGDKRGRATFEKFEIEGGITLKDTRGFVEDPFQLVGMNKMNLPGVRLDGILGYTILARYRIEFDFTASHLVWTKLNWDPPNPMGFMDLGGKPPQELAAMGTMVQFAAALVGRQPDPEYIFRGFLGIELVDEADAVRIKKVIPNSPAAEAGLKANDRVTRMQDRPVKSIAEVHKVAAELSAGKDVTLDIEREGKKQAMTVRLLKGL